MAGSSEWGRSFPILRYGLTQGQFLKKQRSTRRKWQIDLAQDRPAGSPYEIVESQAFLDLAGDLLGNVERWDEMKWAGDWLLEKDPLKGNYLPHYDLWVLMLGSDPIICVYYRIDHPNRQVIPHDIQVFPF